MATRLEIRCINKSNRTSHYGRISNIGGLKRDETRWKMSEVDAIAGIKSGKYIFYVNRGRSSVDVIIEVGPSGREYLKTRADALLPDNLLSLPECP